MATAEQFAALMQQTSQLATAVNQMAQLHAQQTNVGTAPTSSTGPTRSRDTRIIDSRHLRYTVFDGTHSKYDDWAFSFKRAIRSASCEAYKLLACVERETVEVREDEMELEYEGVSMENISAELYDLLCQACTGDALSCIRSVDDMRGLTAWHRLYKKYNPKTMARAIRLVGAVTHPPKVKELRNVEAALDKWEEQLKVLKKDFGETFSETVRIGIATAMMPESVQEFVYSSLGATVEYDATLAKIRALVSNKVAMADGPTPMEVDRVVVDAAAAAAESYEEDQEIDVVNMSIQCHGCGGWGHYKSKCPTAWAVMQEQQHTKGAGGKGPGKGGKSSGKGPSGPWARSGPKGGKGGKSLGGKGGFLGKCFKCGETGHRQQDCTKVGAIHEEAPDAGAPPYHVDSVWDIGGVDIEGDWQVQKGRRRAAASLAAVAVGDTQLETERPFKTKCSPRAPRDENRFKAFQMDDGADEDENQEGSRVICGVDGKDFTREAQLEFCEADVRKPLVSAVRVAKAGNGMWLDAHGGYVVNLATEERMEVRVENGVYVMDVQYDDETVDVFTLDSGAGCNVWPKGRRAGKSSELLPKKAGVGMVAANNTPIGYYGQRRVRFRGVRADSDFAGPR